MCKIIYSVLYLGYIIKIMSWKHVWFTECADFKLWHSSVTTTLPRPSAPACTLLFSPDLYCYFPTLEFLLPISLSTLHDFNTRIIHVIRYTCNVVRYNYVPSSGHIYHAPILLVLSPLFILVCSRIYCHIIWLLPRAFSDKEYPPPSSNFNSLSWLHHLLPFFNRFYILSPRSRHYCFFLFFSF